MAAGGSSLSESRRGYTVNRQSRLRSDTFCERLLYENRCAIIPGSAFGDGGEGFARISYAYSVKHITQALERIEAFVRKL